MMNIFWGSFLVFVKSANQADTSFTSAAVVLPTRPNGFSSGPIFHSGSNAKPT